MGGVLLPFYVFVPLWRLRSGAASAKAAVKEAASEEGHSYKEKVDSYQWGDEGEAKKIVLMFEKALLAIIVLMQVSSWFAVGISGAVGWLARFAGRIGIASRTASTSWRG